MITKYQILKIGLILFLNINNSNTNKMLDTAEQMFYNDIGKQNKSAEQEEILSRIKAVTNDKKLIITSRPIITSGSKNVDTLAVVLDKTWNFTTADYYVNFFIDSDTNGVIRKLSVTGNVGTCDVPIYITRNEGFFHFGVFAKANDDVIKTSDIAGYEVKKGICVEPEGDEHDTLAELKKRFVDMINSAIFGISLQYDMRFEDIDLNFSDCISALYSSQATCNSFINSLYEIIKEFIDADYQKEDDPSSAYITYLSTIRDYLEDNVSRAQYNSVSDELETLTEFKSDIFDLIKEKIDSAFSADNDLSLYTFKIEEKIDDLTESNESYNAIIVNLYNLYTGGNVNV